MRALEDRTVARGETAVLQCIAGGSPAPRLNWTKDDGPLVLTERHFFAAANQLLIIVDAGPDDAGKYTCIMSNTLGTERGHIYLSVSPSANCDIGAGYDQDGWITVGIVVIVVVCCVVGTSLVWVIVIYHMRRRSEDYSITNTGRDGCLETLESLWPVLLQRIRGISDNLSPITKICLCLFQMR